MCHDSWSSYHAVVNRWSRSCHRAWPQGEPSSVSLINFPDHCRQSQFLYLFVNLLQISDEKNIKSGAWNFPLNWWMRNIACHIRKQRTWQPSNIALQIPGHWTLKELKMDTMPPLQPVLVVHPEEIQDEGTQHTCPREWRYIPKEWVEWAQMWHLPKHRKGINSLTWDIEFSLINNSLLIPNTWSLVEKYPCIFFPPTPLAFYE